MDNIELKLLEEFNLASVEIEHQKSILELLRQLKKHDLRTYEHSVNVALLSAKIARTLGLNTKPFLFTACLHDIGKIAVPNELLRQKKYDPKTQPEIDKHTIYSYEILRKIHPFSAEVALFHHRFQLRKNKLLPEELNQKLPLNVRKKAARVSRLISLADHFNAATTRINPKLNRPLTREEALAGILKQFPKQRGVIKKLISSKVFSGEAPTTQAPKIPQIKRRKKVSTLPKIQKRNLFKRRA